MNMLLLRAATFYACKFFLTAHAFVPWPRVSRMPFLIISSMVLNAL